MHWNFSVKLVVYQSRPRFSWSHQETKRLRSSLDSLLLAKNWRCSTGLDLRNYLRGRQLWSRAEWVYLVYLHSVEPLSHWTLPQWLYCKEKILHQGSEMLSCQTSATTLLDLRTAELSPIPKQTNGSGKTICSLHLRQPCLDEKCLTFATVSCHVLGCKDSTRASPAITSCLGGLGQCFPIWSIRAAVSSFSIWTFLLISKRNSTPLDLWDHDYDCIILHTYIYLFTYMCGGDDRGDLNYLIQKWPFRELQSYFPRFCLN